MDVIENIKKKFSDKVIDFREKSARCIYFEVKPEDIPEVVKYIFKDLGARFITISGIDAPEKMEILYHLNFDHLNKMVSVRTFIEKPSLEIESVTPTIKGAEWAEREIYDLLGVKFKNHPNLIPLFRTEAWDKDEYPLRRDK